MARVTKTTIPWPKETHINYRLIGYKIERVTVSLLALLNEAGENPPNYEPYKTLLPNMRRRLTEAHEAAIAMTYHAPKGGRGALPMWVKTTVKVIDKTDKMLEALGLIEAEAEGHNYDTVISTTGVMLDTCLELLEDFKKVPLADDDTQDETNEDETNEDEDNNSDTLYLLDFSSYLKK